MLNTNTANGSGNPWPGACPEEETLRLFVERALDPALMEAVALHIIDCRDCKDTAKEMAEWLAAGSGVDVDNATPEERHAVCAAYNAVRKRHVQALWQQIHALARPRREYLAAADGQTADQIQQETAIRSGFIHFASCTSPGHKDAWHAKWAVPTAATDETCLRLQVFDGNEQPIPSGTLVFCGVDLEIEDGYAFMPVKTFRENVGVSLIALKKADGSMVPGEPVRAYDTGR